MARYKNPKCQAEDQEDPRGICGVEMKLIGERHPLYQHRSWTFICPRCGAVTLLTEDQLKRTSERV